MKESTKETVRDLVAEMTKVRFNYKAAKNADNSINMNDAHTRDLVLIELRKKINYTKETLINALQNRRYASSPDEAKAERLKCEVTESKLEMLESALKDIEAWE